MPFCAKCNVSLELHLCATFVRKIIVLPSSFLGFICETDNSIISSTRRTMLIGNR